MPEASVGTPQGSVISPMLSNVFLHYVFDLWIRWWRESRCNRDMIAVRYADDFVIGFENRDEAERREFHHPPSLGCKTDAGNVTGGRVETAQANAPPDRGCGALVAAGCAGLDELSCGALQWRADAAVRPQAPAPAPYHPSISRAKVPRPAQGRSRMR
jgi:hypothetical protein